MQRKQLLLGSLVLAGMAGLSASRAAGRAPLDEATAPDLGKPLHAPAKGYVKVAFIIGPQLVAIDLIGPFTVFGSADGVVPSGQGFDVYSVAETRNRYDLGDLFIQSRYTFDDAPTPNVIVVPQQAHSPATIDYIRRSASGADVTMSICTGAFLVAEAGLLDGGRATTHHGAYDRFARTFPNVTLIRGPRYVEDPNVSSSGGESSGIDLSLRVVERYYGGAVADSVAYGMEYRRTPRPVSVKDV
ncbi:MAG TPA: DJ-1/PfpI family protein [Candidatus Binatia bacterium]|nr:DJ-1/PfpI family protein [Candidatus Binatia bacterium]